MHERPLYYVFAFLVALMVVNLVSPVFGDEDVNVEGFVTFDVSANASFIDVSHPPVSVNFTANIASDSPCTADRFEWKIKEKYATTYLLNETTYSPKNWITCNFSDVGQYDLKCNAYNSSYPEAFNPVNKTFGFVTAYLPVSANFTNTTTTGVLPLCVTFTDNSTGGPTHYAWQLNDGLGNQTTNQATTCYTTNGTKIINYTVWNRSYDSPFYPDGGLRVNSSVSRPIYIDSRDGISTIFTTNISSFTGQAKGQVPLSLQFFNNSTCDYRDTLTFNWIFGDGNTRLTEHPVHTYYTPGLYPVSLNASGNWSSNLTTRLNYVNAYLPISANFSSNPITSCLPPVFPVTYSFTTNQTMNGYSKPDYYNWSFDDGTPNATTRDTSHVFNLPGVYNVTLTTLNTTHDISQSERKQISVTGLYANFTADKLIGYQNTTGENIRVNFTSNQTDVFGATYYHWDFGNGGSSIQPNAYAIYNQPGSYVVNFTVGNSCNQFNSTQKTITIIERPIANFDYSPKYGTFPLQVQFTDLTTDSPNQWEWNFGDGSPTVTDRNPIHTYALPGTYLITQVVRNTTVYPIWTNTMYKSIVLTEGFNASFTSNKSRGVSPLTIQFTDTSQPSSLITNWSWDFGDQGKNTQKNPVHTFFGAGNYVVNLTVWNITTGAMGSAESTIEVVEPIYPDFMPNRTVRMNVSEGVQFTDLSIGNITEWHWDFGDGNWSDEQNPVHIFPEFKEYLVNLTTYNWYYEDISSVNYTLNVTEMRAPVADFSAEPTTVNTQDIVYFTSHVQGPDVNSYYWDFGDGQTSTGINPSHQYQIPGKYDVSLRVTNPFGEDTAKKSQYISVRGLIPSFITVPAGWAVVNTPVTFIDTSKGAPVQWHWDFGDGTLGTSPTNITTHTYTNTGTYTVNLTVTNWQPITASTSQQITIVNKTVPQGVDFEVPDLQYSGKAPFDVQFEDKTPSQSGVIEWFWEFGDGSNSFEQAPTHRYEKPGQYTVTLTVRNENGTNEKRRVAYVVVV
ncbi:PKD domain-containing protein [Methanospirillum sp.]|uniref:PKD domain-containing protein n=1 Tax=Methanospirillum sp. TaxID=45200 RepID=UPI002C1D8DDF|nr:PKD domain-containing protein [Methanospirillum sp.]HPP78006.1 PKD domain-containing protein [Methanospirillum sp.]